MASRSRATTPAGSRGRPGGSGRAAGPPRPIRGGGTGRAARPGIGGPPHAPARSSVIDPLVNTVIVHSSRGWRRHASPHEQRVGGWCRGSLVGEQPAGRIGMCRNRTALSPCGVRRTVAPGGWWLAVMIPPNRQNLILPLAWWQSARNDSAAARPGIFLRNRVWSRPGGVPPSARGRRVEHAPRRRRRVKGGRRPVRRTAQRP
jgi:hypothetical protein